MYRSDKRNLKMYDVIILSHERGFKGNFSSLICPKTRKKMRDPEKGAIFDKIKRETLLHQPITVANPVTG